MNSNNTITSDGDKLSIGRDFVDAVTGVQLSHGELSTNASTRRMRWRSTLNCVNSEHILRTCAKQEGKRITYFMSQAI